MMMKVVLCVCFTSFAAGFATSPAAFRSPGIEAANIASTGLTKPDQASTSLHVGVSYGPPMRLDDGQGGIFQRNNMYNNNYRYNNEWQSYEVDPAFTSAPATVAISLAARYPADEALQRERNVKRSVAGATAIACAALLTKPFLPGLLANLPFFYQAYPLQASIATCGLNSALADTISQLRSWKEAGGGSFNFESRRSLSSVVYGALCLGVGSNLMYTKLLPALCPGSGIGAIVSQACLDNFLCAPLLWLPPAYMIKALFNRQSVMESLKNYVKDVREGKLLMRYWSVWLPAQGITFGMVPKHLRVVSTAIFSFIWFLILTSLSAKKND